MGQVNQHGFQRVKKVVRFEDDGDYVPTKKPGKGRVQPEHKKFSFAPRAADM